MSDDGLTDAEFLVDTTVTACAASQQVIGESSLHDTESL
jgi:hypothetical protein